MSDADEMGLTRAAAQGYETYFVPAIFGQWPPVFIERTGIHPGNKVLDVGCGTGVLARSLLPLVGPMGRVTGLDLSASMLAVAKEVAPGADCQQGSVLELPFDDEAFDATIGAFMLMFVSEPDKAVSEMCRVTLPGGRITIGVWEGLETNHVYADLVRIVTDVVDEEAGKSIAWPFALGAPGKLGEIFRLSGSAEPDIRSHSGVARFPSVTEFVKTEIESWLLAESVSDEALTEITAKANEQFSQYCDANGRMSFPINAEIAVAIK
ncbi:MAG: methyltransferase domain-containing protein [Burkholderiaceae bacterium]